MVSLNQPLPSPRGVPLDDLAAEIGRMNVPATRDGDSVVVRSGDFETRVSVEAPPDSERRNGRPQAIIKIRTTLPPAIAGILSQLDRLALMNAMSSLAALTVDREGATPYIGARLTIY